MGVELINEDLLAMFLTVARFQLNQLLGEHGGAPLNPLQIEAIVRAVPGVLLVSITDLSDREAFLKEAARRLELEQRVQIADPTLLRSNKAEWYMGSRKLDRPFWHRYKRLLKFHQQFNDKTVAAVDAGSDAVVSGLGDPREQGPFDSRGLVVGQVQSGKTTSYSAVINKAIDAGYRVIIVLTGLHEGLRAQTQQRIEEGVRGLATDSGEPGGIKKDQPLPLMVQGEVPVTPAMLTTRASDFSANAQHFAFLAGSAPVILVIKKNAIILRHVQNFFKQSHLKRVLDPATGREEIDGLPLLLIDDEADAASVDTNIKKKRKEDEEYNPATINREIRRLLVMFRQRSYAAYTATPYANILIHKDNETLLEGADLFPRDFVVMLPAPSNYVGPGVFFGEGPVDEEQRRFRPRLTRIVDDCGIKKAPDEDWMPLLHKKTHKPHLDGGGIPESLKEACLSFLLAISVRRLRGQVHAHNSMLIHVTRFTDVQKHVLEQVRAFLYETKGTLEGISDAAGLLARLEVLWNDFSSTQITLDPDDRGTLPPWGEVLLALRETLEIVQVRAINSTESGGLNYDAHKSGLNVIAIGGDKLSRGLTLEGLSVSYFLRATKMYDTLLQMGRWFGYRPGYKDLCRLYLTQDLASDYRHVTRADEELRAEFSRMQDEVPPLRPEDYGLRVRSHPTLLVTSPGKMASGEKLNVDFGGKVSQTIHFLRDRHALQHNFDAAKSLLSKISDFRVPLPPGKNGALFKDVSNAEVEGFMKSYIFNPRSRRLAPEKLLSYLRSAWSVGVARDWTVYLASGGEKGEALVVGEGNQTWPVWRGLISEEVSTYELGVLSSPSDLTIDLRSDQRALVEGGGKGTRAEQKARAAACHVRAESSALLVIYVVQPTTLELNARGDPVARPATIEGGVLPVGFAMALPPSTRVKLPDYVVNSVLFDELEQEFIAAEDLEAA